MTTYTDTHRIMLQTDAQLKVDASDSSLPVSVRLAASVALTARNAAHSAADRLSEGYESWSEIHGGTYVVLDDTPTLFTLAA